MVRAEHVEAKTRIPPRVARAELPPQGAVARSLSELPTLIDGCRRCDLWRNATQGVPGMGPAHAKLMLVGEQPGDLEDQAVKPFVGPSGMVLDRALT